MICLTGKIVNNTPNVICRRTDTHTHTHTYRRIFSPDSGISSHSFGRSYIKNLPVTQEGQLTFLLNKFETIDLKTAFADTIGKVGTPARIAFYPLPHRKDKVIRSFLELIYDGRSIIIDDSKDAFR